MSPPDTSGVIEIPGPWQHRYVAANGARFHVADAGPRDGVLVLMLHGFPEFWWAWRAQLPALAEAGYRAAAMDLRGYGGSDKTPRGYDAATLAQDVAGVVKALGHRNAVLVGHGWGGYVGWATATLHPREISALCAVSAPHPSVTLGALRHGAPYPAARHLLAMQVPWRPERRIADPATGYVAAHLRSWSARGSAFPEPDVAAVYQEAMGLWPASHCALEYHRWLFRSRVRSDGRRFNAQMARPVQQPVCCVYGDRDPAVPPGSHATSHRHVAGPFALEVVPGAGHFPHEEQPAVLTRVLTRWLDGLQQGRAADRA